MPMIQCAALCLLRLLSNLDQVTAPSIPAPGSVLASLEAWKAPEVPPDDGRILVLEYT